MSKKVLSAISLVVCLLAFSNVAVEAQAKQGKYLVLFKDKKGTSYTVDKPLEFISQRSVDRRKKQGIALIERDLPPTKTYIDELKKAGANVWYKSRWYNAALVLADSLTAVKIKALPFVRGFENNGPLDLNGGGNLRRKSKFEIETDSVNFGNGNIQARMLGTENLHNHFYKGKGLMIGVLDDGFNKIDKNTYLTKLFTENRIAGTYDFVRNSTNVYDIGGHGNLVLSTMASNTDGKFVGTAPEASYVLLRSEDAPTEKIIEEANWLFAAEYADSVGVDVINSSLGYEDFDYAGYTHPRSDFDGDKALCTKAADWAAQAGILVCVSAGNAGLSGIGAPADGDSVMAIGSVDKNEIRSGFSSVGPTADGRIKPDMAAMGSSATLSAVNANGESILITGSGTSFSGPIFAGFATCFWQANPTLKVMEVQAALKQLGSQKAKTDNLLGFGLPKFGKSLILFTEKEPSVVEVSIFPNPTSNILNIKLPESLKGNVYDVNIYNSAGSQSFNGKFEKINLNIDVANFDLGLYFGTILYKNEKIAFKFLKF